MLNAVTTDSMFAGCEPAFLKEISLSLEPQIFGKKTTIFECVGGIPLSLPPTNNISKPGSCHSNSRTKKKLLMDSQIPFSGENVHVTKDGCKVEENSCHTNNSRARQVTPVTANNSTSLAPTSVPAYAQLGPHGMYFIRSGVVNIVEPSFRRTSQKHHGESVGSVFLFEDTEISRQVQVNHCYGFV